MESGYGKLATALSINLVLMFFLTYIMIADAGHFHANLNRIYMALVMVAPMGIVMLIVMRGMFPDQRVNGLLHLGFAAVLVAVFALARTQTPIGNGQFLRSMIPHHSSAILMCEEAAITDAEIARLCGEIVKAQREEIAQMEAILERY